MNTWIGDKCTRYNVGQVGFLLESHNINGGNTPSYYLSDHPGHTNMSHEPRLSGWLGTTDNVYGCAHGLARVTRVARNGRALVVALTEQEQEAVLEELGYPELE